jgi:predicted deacylase
VTADTKVLTIAGTKIGRSKTKDIELVVSQRYSGEDVSLPVRVVRGAKRGPVVLLTAAVHGDEINGTGVIRAVANAEWLALERGTLILVPVVNILGFERGARYMPDRRDLNRCFPGIASGSLSSRVARAIFDELVSRADYCIDFHTAAVHRTNFPNVRGDLTDPKVDRLARAFGCPLVINHPGIKKSLRLSASQAGHPSIILEAGEISKMEPTVVAIGVRGVRNVLSGFGMISGEPDKPAYLAIADETKWLRSDAGGLLWFHARPGDPVTEGQSIATVTSLLGKVRGAVTAPRDGVMLSSTTNPAVKPGDPVCHLAYPRDGIQKIRRALRKLPNESLHEKLRNALGSSVAVEPESEGESGE